MIWVYFGLNFIPVTILILKIKNKEFEDPILFILIILWLIGISIFWYYMEWFVLEGWNYDPQIWKN